MTLDSFNSHAFNSLCIRCIFHSCSFYRSMFGIFHSIFLSVSICDLLLVFAAAKGEVPFVMRITTFCLRFHLFTFKRFQFCFLMFPLSWHFGLCLARIELSAQPKCNASHRYNLFAFNRNKIHEYQLEYERCSLKPTWILHAATSNSLNYNGWKRWTNKKTFNRIKVEQCNHWKKWTLLPHSMNL